MKRGVWQKCGHPFSLYAVSGYKAGREKGDFRPFPTFFEEKTDFSLGFSSACSYRIYTNKGNCNSMIH